MTKKKTKLFTISILVIFLAGCNMWTNFTTYFNRFYNAKEKFIEAEEAIKNEKKELFEFRSQKIVTKAKTPLEDVIEGCSKILQYNKESSYVNESLFLLGKSFYYQQKYNKAERKFSELYAQGKSELYLESKLWLSKAKLQLRKFEVGLKLIDEVVDSVKISENKEILTEALISKTAFYLFRGNIDEAIKSAVLLLENVTSDELGAEICYEIGKMYLSVDNIEDGLKYFSMVENYTPTFGIEVASKLEVARLKNKTGKTEESLVLLEEMKDQSKYEKYFSEIDLELGIVNLDLGNFNEALDILTEVDTVYSKEEASGMARYYKAVLYDKGLRQIDSAITYYTAAISSHAPLEYQDLARDRAKLLGTYVELKKEIDGYYRDYAYLADSTLFAKDSLDFERIWQEDSLKLVEEFEEKSNGNEKVMEKALQIIDRKLNLKHQENKPVKNDYSTGELNEKLSKAQYEMGSYFYSDVIEYDSAAFYFDDVLIHYPDSIKTPQHFYTLGSFYSTIGDTLLSDSLFNIVYENYSTELIANEAAKRLGKPLYNFDTDPAKDIFNAAEKKYESGNFEEALSDYKLIFRDYKDSPYAPKSLLVSSYIYRENIKNLDSVMVVYDSLLANYSGTNYTKAISSTNTMYRGFIKARQDSLDKMLRDSLELIRKDSLAKLGIIDSLNIPVDSTQLILKDSVKVDQSDSLKTKQKNKRKLPSSENERETPKAVTDTTKKKRATNVER
ncbi:MAG: hypothetical protein ACEPO8_14765 [Rhodothermaceae bacterium]